MRLGSASRSSPGKHSGKQNGPRLGVRGSTDASKASLHRGLRQLPLRPVVRAESRGFGTLPMPNRSR